MSGELLQTPLHAWHVARGGKMVDFAGWSMPVQYGSIVEEHNACRKASALFDVSHMGRLYVHGPGSTALLERLMTRQVANVPVGKVRYSLVCNEAGGILDDVLVYSLLNLQGEPFYLVIVNASNRLKIFDWMTSHCGEDVVVIDRTLDSALIALQGPHSPALLSPHVPSEVLKLGNYSALLTQLGKATAIISRTGYTGEDGFEILTTIDTVNAVWSSLIAAGASPAGLAARDTLRLEAAMPLYGHELNENINPYQAGLSFAVNLSNRDFIGRNAIAKFQDDAKQLKRVGLAIEGRRVPREQYAVMHGDERVGEVTSGTFSPTLDRPIAMAYVSPEHETIGRPLEVDIRGSRVNCQVVELPFYKRHKT